MLVTHLADKSQRPFRIISVSRWGYLRTPIPRDPALRTAEAQADSMRPCSIRWVLSG